MVKEQRLSNGMTILGFDSVEEMAEYTLNNREAADSQKLPEQDAITWGDYVVRLVNTGDKELAIFGHILTEEEILHREGLTEPDDEFLFTMERIREAHHAGHRYGEWFSKILPEGETGSAHVVSLWQIEEADFVYALDHDWVLNDELLTKVLAEVTHALKRAGREGDINE